MYKFKVNNISKPKVSINQIFYGLFILFSSFLYIEYVLKEVHCTQNRINLNLLILSCLLAFWIYRKIVQHSNYRTCKITTKGFLELTEEKIKYCGEEIPFEIIKNIEINAEDFKGKYERPNRFELQGCLSFGNKNNFKIHLKNGETLKKSFCLERKGEIFKIASELVNLNQKGLLSCTEMYKVLGLKNYNEIQNFKLKYHI